MSQLNIVKYDGLKSNDIVHFDLEEFKPGQLKILKPRITNRPTRIRPFFGIEYRFVYQPLFEAPEA